MFLQVLFLMKRTVCALVPALNSCEITESDASEQSLREQGLCCATSLQPCPTLCHPMDCSLPGSSAHGILQARILEQVAIFFSRGSSQPRDKTQVSCTAGRFFTV